jgi:deoxyadenosine/deoxycytidine kinase
MIIYIEGNIGAGKSTFMNYAKEKNYKVFKERENNWGEVMELFDKYPRRYCFLNQMNILNDMLVRYDEIKNSDENDIIFVERHIQSVKLFTDFYKSINYLDEHEYKVFNNYFDRFHRKINIDENCKCVYLDVDSDVCETRKNNRVNIQHNINSADIKKIEELYLSKKYFVKNTAIYKEKENYNDITICNQNIMEFILNEMV